MARSGSTHGKWLAARVLAMAATQTTSTGLDLHVDLDRSGLRSSLEAALRTAVRTGRVAPGTRMPSSRALAADLGVARGTVSQVYEQLVAEGYLTSRQGSGTRVAGHRVWSPTAAVSVSTVAAGAGSPTEAPRPRWDLQPGRPDVSSFPRDAWLAATRRVLATSPPDALGYGDSRGRPELRRALADYLGRVRGVVATSEQVIVCAGYSQALAMVSWVLTARRQRSLAFENPSFDFHRAIASRAGLDTPGVPVDADGIVVDEIPGRAVVVTPAHQFPLGMTLAPGRRSALAEWAHRRNGLVVEDDYDGEFRYDRQPVGAMQGLAPDRVVYAGTASKTLAPGLRISWLAVPPDLTDAVVESKGYPDAHPSALDQLVLADLLSSGAYDRHVRQCRTRYRTRRNRLVAVLAEKAPGVRVVGAAAGLQAVLELPTQGPTEAEVLARANELGLSLSGLAPYWMGSGPHPPGLVVGYATPPEHAFEPTLAVLADVLTERSRVPM